MLGELPVEVRDGVARIAGTETIAGSTLTLDRAVRNCVAAGVPLAQAVRAATAAAGRLPRTCPTSDGSQPGKRADLVVLDDDLNVTRVMQHGAWL